MSHTAGLAPVQIEIIGPAHAPQQLSSPSERSNSDNSIPTDLWFIRVPLVELSLVELLVARPVMRRANYLRKWNRGMSSRASSPSPAFCGGGGSCVCRIPVGWPAKGKGGANDFRM